MSTASLADSNGAGVGQASTPNGGAGGSNASGTNGSGANGAASKVVGPNVTGRLEEYQLVRKLQGALFGGVYEAKGLSTGKDFAVKVLHKSELSKAKNANSIEFCEVPLSEIRFAETMQGHSHVMEVKDHFEDDYCNYIAFELARGGDLLEALKQKPQGFDEKQAQFLVKQAAKGLAFLHQRSLAMQDVSLENLLLHVPENTGHYQIKICDPGQAVTFEVDAEGVEQLVPFRGLVGKSFRPPELHEQRPYLATKVDAWCLGWSTFYLLTAQPLFMSADPAQQDADWHLFRQSDFSTLFKNKGSRLSTQASDFVLRLLRLEPSKRMSVADALSHAWLTDPDIPSVLLAAEAPESLTSTMLPAEASVAGQQQTQQVQQQQKQQQQQQQPGLAISGLSSLGGTPLPASKGNPLYLPLAPSSNVGGQMPPRLRSPRRSPRAAAVALSGVSVGVGVAAQISPGGQQSKMPQARSSSSNISQWAQVQLGNGIVRTRSPIGLPNATATNGTVSQSTLPSSIRASPRGASPHPSVLGHGASITSLIRPSSPALASSRSPAILSINSLPSSATSISIGGSFKAAGGGSSMLHGRISPNFTPRVRQLEGSSFTAAPMAPGQKVDMGGIDQDNGSDPASGRAWTFRSDASAQPPPMAMVVGNGDRHTDRHSDAAPRPRAISPIQRHSNNNLPTWSGANASGSSSQLLMQGSQQQRSVAQSPSRGPSQSGIATWAQRSMSPIGASLQQPGTPAMPLQARPLPQGILQSSPRGLDAASSNTMVRGSPRNSSPALPMSSSLDAQGRSLNRALSPRGVGSLPTASVVQTSLAPGGLGQGVPMAAKFAWSPPDPQSPSMSSRSFSPGPGFILKGPQAVAQGVSMTPRWFQR